MEWNGGDRQLDGLSWARRDLSCPVLFCPVLSSLRSLINTLSVSRNRNFKFKMGLAGRHQHHPPSQADPQPPAFIANDTSTTRRAALFSRQRQPVPQTPPPSSPPPRAPTLIPHSPQTPQPNNPTAPHCAPGVPIPIPIPNSILISIPNPNRIAYHAASWRRVMVSSAKMDPYRIASHACV